MNAKINLLKEMEKRGKKMPGIFGTNINNSNSIMEKENRIYKNLNCNNWYLELSSIKKFYNDKTLYDNENYIVLIDGVILNLNSLKEEFKITNIEELIIKMYEKIGNQFFNKFRGNFCGFFQDKKTGKVLIYTNHTGDKTIFYYSKGNEIIFASEIKHIVKCMKENNIKYTMDKRGIYCILTYAYMYNDLTTIQEIKRLIPGNYIKIENGKIDIIPYYKVSNDVIDTGETEEQIMANIEDKFKKAVELQVNKNKEYGYDDVAPLSAGLDSRMTNYMIKKVSDKPIYNITYSQTGQLDEKTPANISAELKNHWIFKNLDNGLALYYIDESIVFSDGILYYVWPSQLYDFIKILDSGNIGIVHTGVIGDVIIGTFFKNPNKQNYEIGDGAYSKRLLDKLKEIIDIKDYENHEIGMMYNRAFNGAVLGYSMVFEYYTEAISPFMNIEFMEYCMSLPLKYRKNHNIYYKWVRKYHPDAAKYSHNGKKIPKEKSIKIGIKGKQYPISSIPSMINNKVRPKLFKNNNMNPIQYWYETNDTLKNIMDGYFNNYICLMDNYKDIQLDMKELYSTGTAMEKTQVISVLAFMKKYFKEK